MDLESLHSQEYGYNFIILLLLIFVNISHLLHLWYNKG